MSCCIGRKGAPEYHNPEVTSQEVKRQLSSIDSQKSMVAIFKTVLESEPHRTTLVGHFEQSYSPELPYYIEDFIRWEKEQTKEGAEEIFKKYFDSDALYLLDVENGDGKRIKFLLSDFNSNRQLLQDMFHKYCIKAMGEMKNNYNPKPA